MDVRHLRSFLAVGEHLNFTKASRQLFLTQSAVSYQVSTLEKELEVLLFERAPHSVNFTPAGRFFHQRVKEILATYEGAVSDAKRIATGATGSISIGFLGGGERAFLSHIIKRYRANYPEVSIRLERYDLFPLSEAMVRGELDVVFTLAVGVPAQIGFQTRLLTREPLVAVMAARHPLAGRADISFKDLTDQHLVELAQSLNAPAHTLLVDVCGKHGFVPRTIERFSSLYAVFMAVEAGMGIVVLPKYRAVEHAKDGLAIVPLSGADASADCVVAWKPNTPNPAVSAFIRELGVF